MTSGNVFNIQKYSIHDGPGIRTTVFFKGCPLNCWWCHNPESQSFIPELIFYKDKCIHCETCFKICPSGAIKMKEEIPVTDRDICTLCGKCVSQCPTQAREMIGRKVTTREVMKEIEKDIMFYRESGGGVTFSGGEPLAQDDFLEELLHCCKDREIHTTLDTSGYATWQVLDKIRDRVDLFLYDVKIMDNKKHKKYTGVSNKIILENLKKLSLLNENIFVRIPVIPGINDDEQNIKSIGEFLSPLKIKQVELLPYHNIGSEKYKRLGKIYQMKNTPAPSGKKLTEISNILKGFNLNIELRG